jgi:alanyl-tRNA synthetase
VGGLLPGPAAFKLYDTYGLALDEQEEMAREAGLSIDRDGFNAEMEKQRTRARASWKGADKTQVNPVYQALPKTEFLGREMLEAPATVTAVLEGEIALDRTPFYAEAGGQVGDTGLLVSEQTGETVAVVESTYSAAPGKSVHRVKMLAPLKQGDTVIARVDTASRHSTMRNHTGTHLLHAALRTVLGGHVKQAGSVVEPSRLRFDFSHYTAMDPDELAEVERLMNEQILANRAVVTNVMDLDQALQTGAMALFGEKYGEHVRVVQIDSFSKELCGGTHVERTGDIGICKIVYEGSISAGVRRIEAITGAGALKRFQEAQAQLARVAGAVKTSESELLEHIEKLLAKERQLESELQQLKTKMAQTQAGQFEPKEVKGVKVLYQRVDGVDKAQLRVMADDLRNRFGECVVVLGTASGEVVAGVTKGLTAKVAADKSIRSAGAKGGGRADMAEGRVQDLDAFFKSIERIVEEAL